MGFAPSSVNKNSEKMSHRRVSHSPIVFNATDCKVYISRFQFIKTLVSKKHLAKSLVMVGTLIWILDSIDVFRFSDGGT